MKNIFVRKIFPYDPTNGGQFSKYQGYELITTRQLDVGISQEIRITLPGTIASPILASNLKRGQETGEVINRQLGITVQVTGLLAEVGFSIKSLLTEQEYQQSGSSLVRQRFLKCFIADTLAERRQSIKQRMDKLMSRLNKLPDGSYLIISHSFFMKLLQFYISHDDLFDRPELLKEDFVTDKKTFNFGEGFKFVCWFAIFKRDKIANVDILDKV